MPPPDLWTWLTTGNAPGYFAALIASGAAFFAYRSSSASRRSADAAQKQLFRLEEERERELADQFSVWITSVEPASYQVRDDGVELQETRQLQGAYRVKFAVSNAAKIGVTSVHLFSDRPPTDEEPSPHYLIGSTPYIPPSGSAPIDMSSHFFVDEIEEAPYGVMFVGALFVDGRGRHWRRTIQGALEKVSPEEFADEELEFFRSSARFESHMNWPADMSFPRFEARRIERITDAD